LLPELLSRITISFLSSFQINRNMQTLANSAHFHKTTPIFADRIKFMVLAAKDVMLHFVAKRYNTFIRAFRLISPRFLDYTSRVRARRAYYLANATVPPTRDFIAGYSIKKWSDIPCTDKDNYIKKYPTAQRCLSGCIPLTGVAIDESSGSTGTPYNWVRSLRERQESHAFISYSFYFQFW
jgi:hypothetical protein